MTVANALSFINKGLEDKEIRDRLNSASSPSEIDDILANEKLRFSMGEFSEAYYKKLTECQETETADRLKEFKMWWEFLMQLMNPAGYRNQCSGGCPG